MEQWWRVGQANTVCQRHSIARRFEFSRLERPGRVVYIASIHAVMLHHSVEAVALGEPVLECTALSRGNRGNGTIQPLKLRGRRTAMGTAAAIVNAVIHP